MEAYKRLKANYYGEFWDIGPSGRLKVAYNEYDDRAKLGAA